MRGYAGRGPHAAYEAPNWCVSLARERMADAQARWLIAASAIAIVAVVSLVVLPQRAPDPRQGVLLPERWRFFFTAVLAFQLGHVSEHVSQMIQLHVLGLPPQQARGVIGALDVEWVHFLWSTFVLVATVALLRRLPRNRWLALALVLAVWHELEHVTLMTTYLATGVSGSPGLLASGGLIDGGLPISRPDLHFLYNAMLTVPLFLGFRAEILRRAPLAAVFAR